MQPEVPAGPPTAVAEADAGVRSVGTLHWWLIGAIILVDQISKVLVQRFIPVFDSVTLVPGLIDLVHIHNAGVAFGLMNDMDHPYRSALTLGLALAALAGIVYYSRQIHQGERLARTGLSLILGGAVGNLIDRVRLGHVVDFIDVYRGNLHFWAFNVADAAISCGAVLIFIELFFAGRHASHSVRVR
jgi:signal peptidase II